MKKQFIISMALVTMLAGSASAMSKQELQNKEFINLAMVLRKFANIPENANHQRLVRFAQNYLAVIFPAGTPDHENRPEMLFDILDNPTLQTRLFKKNKKRIDDLGYDLYYTIAEHNDSRWEEFDKDAYKFKDKLVARFRRTLERAFPFYISS